MQLLEQLSAAGLRQPCIVHFLACPTIGGKTGLPTPALLYFSGWLSMAFLEIGSGLIRVHWSHKAKHFRLECSGWLVQTNDTTHFQKPWTANLKITVHQLTWIILIKATGIYFVDRCKWWSSCYPWPLQDYETDPPQYLLLLWLTNLPATFLLADLARRFCHVFWCNRRTISLFCSWGGGDNHCSRHSKVNHQLGLETLLPEDQLLRHYAGAKLVLFLVRTGTYPCCTFLVIMSVCLSCVYLRFLVCTVWSYQWR